MFVVGVRVRHRGTATWVGTVTRILRAEAEYCDVRYDDGRVVDWTFMDDWEVVDCPQTRAALVEAALTSE
jgi:hypothetical protein